MKQAMLMALLESKPSFPPSLLMGRRPHIMKNY